MNAIARAVGAVLIMGALVQGPSAWRVRPCLADEAIPASKSLTIDGLVQTSKTYNLEQLQAKPATTEEVSYSTGSGPVTATYKGVLLWSLLQEAEIKTDPAIKNDILHRSVLVTATDGYQAVLSLGEISPSFGGGLAIVAYEQDGKPLGTEGGFARLIVPGDKAGGRNVSSVVRIEVK